MQFLLTALNGEREVARRVLDATIPFDEVKDTARMMLLREDARVVIVLNGSGDELWRFPEGYTKPTGSNRKQRSGDVIVAKIVTSEIEDNATLADRAHHSAGGQNVEWNYARKHGRFTNEPVDDRKAVVAVSRSIYARRNRLGDAQLPDRFAALIPRRLSIP